MNLHIDGTAEDGTFQGDANKPPFVVFDIDSQLVMGGYFLTERVLADQGIRRHYSGWQISPEIKATINDAAKLSFSSEVSKAIDAVAQPALDEIRRKLDAQLETGLRARLDALAREALRGALK